MTLDRSILCYIRPHSSHISIADASSPEASHMSNVFLNSLSGQQTTMIQNVLSVPCLSSNLLLVLEASSMGNAF